MEDVIIKVQIIRYSDRANLAGNKAVKWAKDNLSEYEMEISVGWYTLIGEDYPTYAEICCSEQENYLGNVIFTCHSIEDAKSLKELFNGEFI